jgi:hypothetical protein
MIFRCLTWTAFLLPTFLSAQNLKNFQGTSQRVALIGVYNEYVEPSIEESVVKEVREIIGRYSASYKTNEIANFKLISNPNNQYFKPSPASLSETQKQFLTKTAQDNSVEIIVLNVLRENAEGLEIELQLYDSRIDTLSDIQAARFNLRDRKSALEDISYRLFNHMDRDGFVHPDPQDILEKPGFLVDRTNAEQRTLLEDEFVIDPDGLAKGQLADDASIGGEQTPFWEKWWFWTAIGAGIATAGGLSYYFLVVDQPPTRARVRINIP